MFEVNCLIVCYIELIPVYTGFIRRLGYVCEIFALPLVTTPPLGAAKVSVVLDRNADTTRLIFPPFRIRKLFL